MLLRVKVFKQRKFKLGESFAAARRKTSTAKSVSFTIVATEMEVKEIRRICAERYGQKQTL